MINRKLSSKYLIYTDGFITDKRSKSETLTHGKLKSFGKSIFINFKASVEANVAYKDFENEIPVNYRPSEALYFLGIDDNNIIVTAGILTNGTIRIYPNRQALTNFICVFNYIL